MVILMNSSNLQIKNKYMEYVVALEKYGNISIAAEAMYISQPAMSHFIISLEDKIGFKLFNRVNNKYVPTYEGERYIYYAKKILALEDQMQNEFSNMDANGYGRIRLALPALRSSYILPILVPAYHKLYPNVKIVVQEVHSELLEKLLLEGEVDFAILNTKAKSKDTVSVLIRKEEILLAVSANHSFSGCGEKQNGSSFPFIDINLFRDDNFFLQYPNQHTRLAADQILSDAGFTPSVFMETHSIETSLKMVANGMGICFVPETYARQIMLPNSPVYFSLGSPHSVFDISLAYLKKTYQPNSFLSFIDTVKKTL